MWGKDFTDALIILIILLLLREENHGKDTGSLSAYDPEWVAG
jgi:hypothetical protein